MCPVGVRRMARSALTRAPDAVGVTVTPRRPSFSRAILRAVSAPVSLASTGRIAGSVLLDTGTTDPMDARVRDVQKMSCIFLYSVKTIILKSAHVHITVFKMSLLFPAECDCRGGRCDPRTGECRCPDGMTGKQCDACSQKYSVPVEKIHSVHCERK